MMNHNIMVVLEFILAILVVASLTTFLLKTKNKHKDYTELALRIKSWWVMAIVFIFVNLVNPTLALFSIGFLCFLSLKEYLSMIPTRRTDRRVLFFAYLSIPIHFYWIYLGWYGMFIIFIPIYVFLFLPLVMVLIGDTKGFLKAAGTLHWGLMLVVFGLSHIAYLLALPTNESLPAGVTGLLLYVVVLTQLNDVSQYIWGKMFGKHKVVPTVSPNKTIEGLIGGIGTTTVLSVFLGPILTPMDLKMALIAGFLISFLGFIGDVNISAIKRDLGIKDSGSSIPGHGGILDRVDSLTYTAPVFFHFIYYFYF